MNALTLRELAAAGVQLPPASRKTAKPVVLYGTTPLTDEQIARIRARAREGKPTMNRSQRRAFIRDEHARATRKTPPPPRERVEEGVTWAVQLYVLHIEGEEPTRVTFAEFFADNFESFSADELDEIRTLAPGATFTGGGGAQPRWSITKEDTSC